MSINCVVIDDEPLARKGLKEYIADVDFLDLVGEFDSPLAATDMISRGEVHGGKKGTLYAAALFYLVVIVAILVVSYTNKTVAFSAAFLVLFGIMIFMPLRKAMQNPKGALIGKAVKAGVLALILMNAAWAAAFGTLSLALFIVLLLPLSIWMAKAFAVT